MLYWFYATYSVHEAYILTRAIHTNVGMFLSRKRKNMHLCTYERANVVRTYVRARYLFHAKENNPSSLMGRQLYANENVRAPTTTEASFLNIACCVTS